MCGTASDILIAGRIKKLATIVDKLNRPRTPSDLQTMYDIAGCRLVVPDMATLNQVHCELAKISAFDGPKTERHDYIARPRPSGYRGRHVILRYDDLACGHKLFVEVQLRTVLQHAWATGSRDACVAVKTRLKFNEIDNPIGRFFKKAALLIAQMEEGDKIDASVIRLTPRGNRSCLTALQAAETPQAGQRCCLFSP